MDRLETRLTGWEPIEAVTAFKCRVMAEHDRLALFEFGRSDPTRRTEHQARLEFVKLAQAGGHPLPLAVDRIDRAPVDHRCARSQRLFCGVAEPHVCDEREAVRELEPDFDAWLAVPRGRG